MLLDAFNYYLVLCSFLVVEVFRIASSDVTAQEDGEFEFELKNKDKKFEEVFKYAMNTCKLKQKASDVDIENILNNFLPSTKTEKCFVACWLESFHVIKNKRFFRDQYIKLSTYGQNSNANTKDVLRQILQGCKLPDSCKIDRCELAYRKLKCINDGALKMNIDPKSL